MYSKGEAIFELRFYQNRRGECPVQDFLEGLQEHPRMKASAWLSLLREKGADLRRPHADILEGAIRELRVSFGRLEMRLLYFIHFRKIIVTNAFFKKTRAVPRSEIELAIRYRFDWLSQFGGGGR